MLKSHPLKELPEFVKAAWWYSGKKSSVHVVFKLPEIRVRLSEGAYLIVPFELPQLNLNLKKRK